MAFGSGSSLATDCWIMRGGSPSSEKALKVGSATRLHQHSSKKPMAHRGSASAVSISRSRRLFSFVQGIRRGDPAFGPLPAYAQKTREGSADSLPRDPLFGEAILEGGLGGHLQSPQATLIPEFPRRAVEHPPQPLGRVRVEGGVHALWSRGASDERIQALLVEGADCVANRLGGAPETLGYLGRRVAAGAGEQYLGSAHHEGISGAQPRLEALALLFRQFPDKYWRFHERNYSPSHTTLSEDALGATPISSPRSWVACTTERVTTFSPAAIWSSMCTLALETAADNWAVTRFRPSRSGSWTESREVWLTKSGASISSTASKSPLIRASMKSLANAMFSSANIGVSSSLPTYVFL